MSEDFDWGEACRIFYDDKFMLRSKIMNWKNMPVKEVSTLEVFELMKSEDWVDAHRYGGDIKNFEVGLLDGIRYREIND